MKRRTVLLGGLTLPLLGLGRPDPPTKVKAVFEEIVGSVQVSLSLPALIRKSDREAQAWIDSGFDTTLVYEVDVWEYGTKRKLASREIVVKLNQDLWSKKYVVRTKGTTGEIRRTFKSRDAAIEAAVTLDRIRICDVALLQRGTYEDGPYYYVTVLAMRNPIKGGRAGAPRRRRGTDRDLEWFGHLVSSLAGERARAEEIVNVRTYPFYLPRS